MAATALAVALFTAVVMAAVVAIAIARQWLAPTGPTELVVNDSRTVTVATGSKLLEALADADVLLPSPCGGRGTCGQCRVRIDAGGAPLLPSDAARIA
ncbi:MAG: 2Fe-2S iron-sulfur cluster-binding protein, partial [Proteobacteria bacterium]|nr:2Fe-2S iron-sulfur cluster-binding protein [Pseudomonadota bacterium]